MCLPFRSELDFEGYVSISVQNRADEGGEESAGRHAAAGDREAGAQHRLGPPAIAKQDARGNALIALNLLHLGDAQSLDSLACAIDFRRISLCTRAGE